MKTIYTIQNFAKRLVLVLAVGLIAINVWGADPTYTYRLVVSKSALADGKRYLLLVNNRTTAYNCAVNASGHLSTGVTFTAGGSSAGSAITTTTAASSINYVTLVNISGDTYKIYDSGGKYVTATAAKSGSFSRADADSYGWTFTGTDGMNARYQEKNKQAYCRSYNNSDFRSYANTSSGALIYLATGCSVTYNANGATSGSVPADSYLYGEGATITVKSNSGTLAKSGGYTFGGWNTKADGSGTTYTAGTGTFTINQDTILYAKWVPDCTDQDVIAFDGDTGADAYVEEVDYGSDPISLSVLSDGDGTVTWYSDDETVATVTGDRDGATVTIVGAGSATITASVAADATYCAGSGDYELTVNPIAPTLSHNTIGKALTVSSITSTGATFSGGIVTNKGGDASLSSYGFIVGTSADVTYKTRVTQAGTNSDYTINTAFDSKSVTGLSPNTTYYVRAIANNSAKIGYSTAVSFTTLQRYAVSYNNNGGSGSMDGAYKDHGVNFTLPSNAGSMSKTGYHIADWKLGSSSGTSYSLGGSYTTDAAATFYAGWEINTYTVTFDKNGGGTGTGTTDQDFTYGTAQNLNACGFTAPTDKYFLGWNTDKDATTATYEDEESVNNLTTTHEGTVTLYAIWKDHTYTNYRTSCSTTYDIVLDKNSGSADGSASVEEDGTTLKNISAPTKTGYKVEGYYAESGKTNKVAAADGTLEKSVTISSTAWTNSDGEWVLGDDATLYAKWEPISYSVRFNKNNESATGTEMSDQDFEYGTAQNLTTNTYSLTGYTFSGWATSSDGSVVHTDGKSVNNLSTTDGAVVDLYAVWTANKYDLTLANTDATSGSSQTVQATYGSSMPLVTTADKTPAVAALSRTGYTFTGWSYSGTQYYSYDGSSISSAHNWDVADSKTLTPDWSINSYTLTWDLDGGTVTSAGTGADVDATGTPSSSVEYNSAISAPTVAKTGYSFTGWNTTPASNMPAANTTYTAQWSINSYNIAVQTTSYVTIKATPSGGSAITEGNNTDVEYNATITLNYSSKDSRYAWGGWHVVKADDASVIAFSGTANNATFTMPAYAVKITAYLYSDYIAWCDPDVEMTGDVHLTSTKDVYVHSTSGAGNLLNISSTDLGSATSIEVGYLDGDDNEVAKSSSLFLLYASDASETIDEMDVSEARTFNEDYSLRYTPDVFNQCDTSKLKLTLKKDDKVLKTVTKEIYGRSLPEEFVIACKYTDNLWYALPNTLAATLETQGNITPLKIGVDNLTTPTSATYVPNDVVYKATGRNTATVNITGIRLTNDGSHYLMTGSDAKMCLSTTNTSTGDNKQVWNLSSTNFGAYTLQMDPSQNPSKKLGMYSGNMGIYGSPAGSSGQIYLLPIENKFTPVDATVQEWGEHGAILKADMTNVASATMNVNGDDPENANLTAVNAESLTKGKYVRVYNEDVTVGDVSNEGKQLYVHWKNSLGNEIGVSQIFIPRVIASSRNMKTDGEPNKNSWTDKEVHILPGVTLTANTDDYSPSGVSIGELQVYPGATLKVASGTLNATTLRLRCGWTRAGDKKYDVARVYIADDAALTKTTASMDYDIYEKSDGKHYYPLAVPFKTQVSTIDYADEALASASIYGKHIGIDKYDGASRATSGATDGNWVQMTTDEYLEPGKGYTITAVSSKGSAIIRVPLVFDNGWTADGEKATIDESYYKNQVSVTAYSGAASTGGGANNRNAGWNMLGVPYMSCFDASDASADPSDAFIKGMLNFLTGEYTESANVYVNVPVHDFSEYIQKPVSEAKLLPGWSFFVQIGKNGTLSFATAGQEPSSTLPIYAPQREDMPVVKTGIELSRGDKSDNTTLLISDKYSANEYEINADLEKMFGNGYTLATYSLSQNTRLAYNAMSTTDARQVIPIGFRAPEDGEYTFSLNPRYAEAAIERVDLIDYQTGEVTNLMMSEYTFTTDRTQDDERFALNVVPRAEVPTGVEDNSQKSKVESRKLIIDDHVFIIHDGLLYDATGKRVTEINK